MAQNMRILVFYCIMLAMIGVCTAFTAPLAPVSLGPTRPSSLSVASRRSAKLCRRRSALRAAEGEDAASEFQAASDAASAREAALRRLAATDVPKAAKKEAAKTPGDGIPEWAFFALPIAGAFCAFLVQYFRYK
jgi:hypothetical protein